MLASLHNIISPRIRALSAEHGATPLVKSAQAGTILRKRVFPRMEACPNWCVMCAFPEGLTFGLNALGTTTQTDLPAALSNATSQKGRRDTQRGSGKGMPFLKGNHSIFFSVIGRHSIWEPLQSAVGGAVKSFHSSGRPHDE